MPRLTVITLGVVDLPASARFYEALGFVRKFRATGGRLLRNQRERAGALPLGQARGRCRRGGDAAPAGLSRHDACLKLR